MKTWEMIKELTDNPGKKFKSNSRDKTIIATANKSDGIDFLDLYNCQLANIGLDREWEEVKEPLSFIELLEVVKKKYDTDITFENNRHEVSFERNSLEYILSILSDRWDSQEIADILLNSEFYIED